MSRKRPPLNPQTKPTSHAAPRKQRGASPLSPRQAAFVAEYLVDLNAKQAAIRAGYSPRTAETQASRLLRNVKVKAVVEAGIAKRGARTEITQAKVLEELTILAHSCIEDYAMSDDGRLVPAEGRPREVMRAVSSVKYKSVTRGTGKDATVTRQVEFRLWDKPNTLKLEGRHTGLFPNEVRVDVGEDTLGAILGRAARRNGKPA